MRFFFRSLCFLVLFLFLIGCKKNNPSSIIDNDIDLDGNKINDSSLSYPAKFLLSKNPVSDLNKPVLIAVHGFSATTFEWLEFRDFAKANNTIQTSLILLGGHGRDYEDFRNATWQDWQSSIIAEYNELRAMGYTNINFIASSTGCPLVLEMINSGKINSDVLKKVIFIDPIVVPANKTLSLVGALGPLLGYSKTELEQGENGFWYKYRPQEALKELNKLTIKIRKELNKGITLPSTVFLKVYKSEKDDAADPVSAVLLDKGIQSTHQVSMVNTDLHVFTRLRGRGIVNQEQINLQQNTFNEIINLIN